MGAQATFLIRLSMDARRQGRTSFWRCGAEHSLEGAPFPAGAFSAAEWATLRAEPMLEVTELSGPAPDPAGALRAQVRAAIAGLSADEYTKGGLPQLGAVRATATLADQAALKDLVASVWAEMTAEGFRRPGDVPPADPAPVTTGDAEPAPVPGDTEPALSAGAAQDDAGAPEEA